MFGLPMISLIYDFSTENSCGNVHKISVNHTCHKSLILLQTASARPKMWQMIQALSTPSTSLACETDFEAVNETHTNRPFQGFFRHLVGGAKILGRARGQTVKTWRTTVRLLTCSCACFFLSSMCSWLR